MINERKDKIKKGKRKLTILFLIYISIAIIFGVIAFQAKPNKNKEAISLSELIVNNKEIENKYVKININSLPRLIISTEEKSFYSITDVDNNNYIVNLTSKTFKEIVKQLDSETQKLNSIYELKGTTKPYEDDSKNLIISNLKRSYINKDLTTEGFYSKYGTFYLDDERISDRTITLAKTYAFIGVFFLILAFGYIVPGIIKLNKGDFGIADEIKMKKSLGKYIPNKEELKAGVIALGLKLEIKQIFKNCVCINYELIPQETDEILEVIKCKYSKYDMYLGITSNSLIIAECESCKHLYQFNKIMALNEIRPNEIKENTKVEDIGHCIEFQQIENCTIKKSFFGTTKCEILLKSGGCIKFMIPKSGGIAMENHIQYCEEIIEILRKYMEN